MPLLWKMKFDAKKLDLKTSQSNFLKVSVE